MTDIQIFSTDSEEVVANKKHIAKVIELMTFFADVIKERAYVHDQSKLVSPEKEGFDKAGSTSRLTYGTDEYAKSLEALKQTLDHHYALNAHHPQHYPNGVNDMNLFDVVEMLLDWRASTMRYANGNIYESLEINKERFGISDQLIAIMRNTMKVFDMSEALTDAHEWTPASIFPSKPGHYIGKSIYDDSIIEFCLDQSQIDSMSYPVGVISHWKEH
ncbi:MAG: DUF5662 family protein [Fibrobacter sp.]|nr:DUF5662 family protein [Fibrobacter sp.]